MKIRSKKKNGIETQKTKINIELVFNHRSHSENFIVSDFPSETYNNTNNTCIIRRHIDIIYGTDISKVLPLFSVKALALWQDDKYGGKVISDYQSSGLLQY